MTLRINSSAVDATVNTKLTGDTVQIVNSTTGALATGTTLIPLDNTIPQITEGDQYLSVTITPTSATNNLMIDVILNFAISNGASATCALFRNPTANAIAAVTNSPANLGYNQQFVIKFLVAAGTTSATTFTVRAGCSAAGTMTVNGVSGAQQMGGVMASSITIAEIRT